MARRRMSALRLDTQKNSNVILRLLYIYIGIFLYNVCKNQIRNVETKYLDCICFPNLSKCMCTIAHIYSVHTSIKFSLRARKFPFTITHRTISNIKHALESFYSWWLCCKYETSRRSNKPLSICCLQHIPIFRPWLCLMHNVFARKMA